MVAILVIALVLVVLVSTAIGLPLLDRACLGIAERNASEYLSVPFGTPATVRAHGTPFLTQAIKGRYRKVEVFGGGVRIGEMTSASLHAELRNVHLSLRDIRLHRVTELPCEHVSGQIELPYGELARVARIPGLHLHYADGKLLASAAPPIPGFSQLARVSGEAVLTLRSGNAVWLRIRNVSVAGISVPSIMLSQLVPTLNVPIPLPPLPWGLRLDSLRATPDGLLVLGSADAVVFRRLVTVTT